MSTAWYFAYGSNMQRATFCGRRGIEVHRAVPARAPGWRLVLDKPAVLPVRESYANIVAAPGADVCGVAYEIAAADLAHIDLTEGVLIGNYERIEIAVHPLAEAAGMPPVAHTLRSDRRDASLRPSTRYMRLLIEGALEHGLPGAYVDFLRGVAAGPECEDAARLRPLVDQLMQRARR